MVERFAALKVSTCQKGPTAALGMAARLKAAATDSERSGG
jgi:hypothetical protein